MRKRYNKILIIIIAIVLLYIVWIKVRPMTHNRDARYEPILMSEEDTQKYIEQSKEKLSEKASDIEGWSLLDKVDAGLGIHDGSDTDGDGLTDKEEIEVYGTNPRRMSTAGDLYTDGYKVENGMDPLQYYEYEGNIEDLKFPKNKCADVVTVKAVEADDLYAYVSTESSWEVYENGWDEETLQKVAVYGMSEDDLGFKQNEDYHFYAGYNIVCNCDVIINLSEILKNNNLNISDILVLGKMNAFEETFSKLEYTVDGDTITLKPSSYIYIASKRTLSEKAKKRIGIMTDSVLDFFGTKATVARADALVIANPLFAPQKRPVIYYTSSGIEEVDNEMLEIMIKEAEEITDADYIRFDEDDEYYITLDDCKEVSQNELENKRKMYDMLPWKAKYEPITEVQSFPQAVLCYVDYEDADTTIDSKEAPSTVSGSETPASETPTQIPQENVRKFSLKEDVLPFENFSSYISASGNCKGISYFTMRLYNTGTYPSQGEYAIDDTTTITWDLSKDPENQTLLNSGLRDYKDAEFTSKHTDKNTGLMQNGLTQGEIEFINMIGCAWAEANEKRQGYMGDNNAHIGYDFQIINEMKGKLDSGKVLEIGSSVFTEDKQTMGGHSVLTYDYVDVDMGEEDAAVFFIYDSNYANSARSGMIIKRNGDSFDYQYDCDDYIMSNYAKDTKVYQNGMEYSNIYHFTVMDENFDNIQNHYDMVYREDKGLYD